MFTRQPSDISKRALRSTDTPSRRWYSSFQSALEAMIEGHGFQQPESGMPPLFDHENEGPE
jgi:hypothetical protein